MNFHPRLCSIACFLSLPILLFSQSLDQRKCNIFPDDGPAAFDMSGFNFTDNYIPSNSFWASPFTEDYVYHARLKYDHATDVDKSYELRIGKGGQIYSFLTSSGETIPPQYPISAPWVDEVWQMVAVDGSLNMPSSNQKYFIHQAGVYLKTDIQTLPFYSPILAEYHDSSDNSYTIVSWGQQAHTSDNLISGYTSSLLYYSKFKNLGNGIIQVDLLMYNFGNDNMDFINIPWGGVRRSTYDHWFSSNPDHTYQEEMGNFGDYLESFANTGGWAAWSSNSAGDQPSLALLMDNTQGTLRMGDAGTIANRDYTVFEGIKNPGTNLGPGKAVRARNFYLMDSSIEDIKNTIINENLDDETFYGSHNMTSNQVDSTAYTFDYQSDQLVATEVAYANGVQVKLRPYENSQPIFIIKSNNDEYRITTDLHTYSPYPYDGSTDNIQLLGFMDNPTKVEIASILVCSGEDYTFPDGTIIPNITATTYQISNAGIAQNGYDSLIYTIVHVSPDDIPLANYATNGPGGIGSTNNATSLGLWLDANQLLGANISTPANGTLISQWIDLSGNSQNYQGLGPNQPTFSTTGDFSAVHFDAAAVNPPFLSGKTQNYAYGTVFMVLKAVDAGDENLLLSNSSFSLKYEQEINAGFLGYSDINTNQHYTSTLASTFGVNNIVSFNADCNNNTLDIHLNNQSDNLNIGNNSNGIPLGQLGTGTTPLSGDFYEIIAFKENINEAQKLLVDNYLSAKYGGIPISNDLFDEDDNANGDFDHDVAGIGRINSDNIHDDAVGSGIIRVNNPSNLEDDEFFIWGHNGDFLTFTDSMDVPNDVVAKSERIWRVSEMNTSSSPIDVGFVDLTFDLSGIAINDLENIVLIIDEDSDGIFGDEIVIPPTTSTQTDYEGQADIYFQQLDIQDGDRFCLAYKAPKAPGGIYENLALWLAADGEVNLSGTQVNSWKDKSENKKVATGGLGPNFSTSTNKLLNYNPVIILDGENDQFQVASIAGLDTHSDVNLFIVSRLNADPHQSTIFREGVSGGGISSHLPWSNGRVFWDAGLSSGVGRLHTPSGLIAGDDAMWQLSSHDGTPDLQYIKKNGQTLASDNTAISITGNSSNFILGSSGGGLYFDGDVAEVIAYMGNTELASHQVQRIESYLALKYAYTLDNSAGNTAGDYINSNDATIWDADANASYHNELIAIARDDASDLYQKQANTRDDSVSVYLDTLTLYNSLNPSSISNDLSSIIIGHDNGVLNDPTSGTNSEKPAGIFARFDREWKVTNHNFSDDFTIKVECSSCGNFDINDIRLLVDQDGNFSDALVFGHPDVMIQTGSIIISGIDNSIIPINSTRYITIGSVNQLDELLAVEWLYFEATPAESQVLLTWATTSEINNNFFTVERSSEGNNWEKLTEIEAIGSSNEITEYETFDPEPYNGISYYRLKQTDLDGQYTYSNIVSVNMGINQRIINLYPNPTQKEKIYVEGNTTDFSNFQITDLLGNDVSYFFTSSMISSSVLEINIKALPNGIYFFRTPKASMKFIKQ